jgi:hypothetical protein
MGLGTMGAGSSADAEGCAATVRSVSIVAHAVAEVVVGDGEPLVMAVPPECPGLVAALGEASAAAEPLVPVPAGVPLPSVPAPPDELAPPVSTVLLA